MQSPNLKQFYIPEEQSIYLLSHADAQKHKDWMELCKSELEKLGYSEISLIGQGAYGVAFGGLSPDFRELVFKFSRITLPQHVQDRLEEEAEMLGVIEHELVPQLIDFQRIGKQSILVMERAMGFDLERISLMEGPLHPKKVLNIASQLVGVLKHLRENSFNGEQRPVVHGDIKPSNIVYEQESGTIGLIDWGSSVFAQVDENDTFISHNVMDLMSGDIQHTNARLGDVYFIGEEQLNGKLSSPRFDEQGLVGTLYALASGQSCRFGHKVIPFSSLGLPKEFARTLENMMDDDPELRRKAGDYLIKNMRYMKRISLAGEPVEPVIPMIPIWTHNDQRHIDTVVYSSRKSFLREEGQEQHFAYTDDVQFERYYKNFLMGMGDTEKAFVAAVSRLAKYPVVGGIAVRWEKEGVYIDSSLNLYEPSLKSSFNASVNNVINLARAIFRVGVFKSCLFNARNTLHLERASEDDAFHADASMAISYEKSEIPLFEDESRTHSYFEDGKDPDELLSLPKSIMETIHALNQIHHTGCIIFEVLPTHMKLHSYYRLLNPEKEQEFKACLELLLTQLPEITGLGISGFMKLPYKDTKFFSHIDRLPEKYYPFHK